MLNYLNLIHDFHSHMLSMNHVNLVLAMTHLALSSHHSSWVHTLFYFMCIASLESGHLLSQCSFYAILFSDLVFVDWNCFQVGPQFVLDFSDFDSFCSSCSNVSRLSRICIKNLNYNCVKLSFHHIDCDFWMNIFCYEFLMFKHAHFIFPSLWFALMWSVTQQVMFTSLCEN
jgi:hypothetical protein